MDAEDLVRQKWRLLKATMGERARRLWAGAEAGALGYGGVAAVARATGMALSTVRKGRDEGRAGAIQNPRQPQGEPELVDVHDFPSDAVGKAIPYGVDDLAANAGFVSVGVDHDTPVFAVTSIGAWWAQVGSKRYPKTREIYINADAGGSNSYRSHVCKHQLQRLADKRSMSIHVSHLPPGTSKWNKVEHRLFSVISINWRSATADLRDGHRPDR